MTAISANIVADSISHEGIRMTTMELRYPRLVHAEVMTHRAFSRNARSSRAVPIERMIQECIDDPVIPIHWGAAQKGMQAYEECKNDIFIPDKDGIYTEYLGNAEGAWLHARDRAVESAKAFHEAGYAKQVVNRLLEPFLHIDTLVSATDYTNWFGLRDHHMAEPHIEQLAKVMKVAMAESTPRTLNPGRWHLPYVTNDDFESVSRERNLNTDEEALDIARKLSVARCARISYVPFDGNASIDAELRRYDLLVGSTPLHASPCEHQATPDRVLYTLGDEAKPVFENPDLAGNLRGWIQFRKMLPNECIY